jgi:peptidoglycan/xylan/chitin deacetylase (PgdA/CDA1 family)
VDVKNPLFNTVYDMELLNIYGLLRKKLTGSQVGILVYHRVCPMIDEWSTGGIDPEYFIQQIEYFLLNKYQIISLDTLAQNLAEGNHLPEKAVVITFDDGYKDNYVYAFPILKKYNITATIFLTTGHIGTNKLLWWDKTKYIMLNTKLDRVAIDELGNYSFASKLDRLRATSIINKKLIRMSDENKSFFGKKMSDLVTNIPESVAVNHMLSWEDVIEMSHCGIDFGAHSVNHPVLTKLPLEHAKWEITQSKKDIELMIGKNVTAFSYPNGNFSDELINVVKESGFACAVAVSPHKLVSATDNLWALSRISASVDFRKFKVMFCGLWGDIQSKLNRLKVYRWKENG